MDEQALKRSADQLEMGDKYPFDAPDSWWEDSSSGPPLPVDWAHRAVRAVIADLQDRCGIGKGFEIADILRVCYETPDKHLNGGA